MTQRFDFTLTQSDMELTTEFMMLLGEGQKEYFCSDDFRGYNLDAAFNDPVHEVGAYFARLKANGVADPVGEVPSEIAGNNFRKVDLWRWNWRRWRQITKSQLTAFTQPQKQEVSE